MGLPGARVVAFVVATALASAHVSVAHAAEPTPAEILAARELFEKGLKQEEKGQWAEALESFRKVAAVKMTPQVRFHIALCLENTGKLVDALFEFQRAQSEAASGDAQAQIVASNAAKHVADLKERIPRVVVNVPSGIEGVTVSIDGKVVAASLIGTAIPLDPGTHKITVEAPKRTTFTKDVELVERGKPVTVDAVLPEGSGDEPPPPPPKDEVPPPETSGGGAGALPWVFGGIGVAALGAGAFMYVLRQGTIRDIENACGPDRTQCPESARPLVIEKADQGKTYTTLGNVFVGVGVLGVATAIVLFAVAPSSNDPPKSSTSKRPTITIGSGPGTVGLGLTATF